MSEPNPGPAPAGEPAPAPAPEPGPPTKVSEPGPAPAPASAFGVLSDATSVPVPTDTSQAIAARVDFPLDPSKSSSSTTGGTPVSEAKAEGGEGGNLRGWLAWPTAASEKDEPKKVEEALPKEAQSAGWFPGFGSNKTENTDASKTKNTEAEPTTGFFFWRGANAKPHVAPEDLKPADTHYCDGRLRFANDFDCEKRFANKEYAQGCNGLIFALIIVLHSALMIIDQAQGTLHLLHCLLWGNLATYIVIYFYGVSAFSRTHPLPHIYQAMVLCGGTVTHVAAAVFFWSFDDMFTLCLGLAAFEYLAFKRLVYSSYWLHILCCPCKTVLKICTLW